MESENAGDNGNGSGYSKIQMKMIQGEERRKPNTLPIWGNAMTMNLNPLILTNIQQSPYFKGPLTDLKTYHEVVDEIYYRVNHLEPWEKGSRKTTGQTGMCGGVRGVGAGGIISTAFCLLYKLFTMRLSRKQVMGLVNHGDSPFIRALGFMYIRFTQPPADLWEWFEPYIEDPETLDVRAGGGQEIKIGDMTRLFLTKLDWYSSLFPRIPVPIQIAIDKKMSVLKHNTSMEPTPPPPRPATPPMRSSNNRPNNEPSRRESRESSPAPPRRHRSRSRDRERHKRRSRSPERRKHRSRSRSPRSSNSHKKRRHRSRSRER